MNKPLYFWKLTSDDNKTRKIYVLLTRFSDNGSKAISFFTKSYYTHASIGLDEDMNTFYSFVCKNFRKARCKGFLVERITRYEKRDREPCPCQLYEIPVSQTDYDIIKQHLLEFVENKEIYRYARLGVVLGLLRIPFRYNKHYFCSQFVAEILQKSEVVNLNKSPSLYMPGDFCKLKETALVFQGNLRGYIKRFVLAPC